MRNMACDQWWFERGCVTLRHLLILQTLLTLGFHTTIGKEDSSYYKYEVLSNEHSLVDDRTQIFFSPISKKNIIRVKRSPPEPYEKPAEKSQSQPSEVQDMQQQPPHLQQQSPQPQKPSSTSLNTNPVNVSYSTEPVTNANPTVTESSNKKYKSDVKSKKTYTVLPTSTADPLLTHLSNPTVWANKTRWTNITQNTKNSSESSDTEIGDIPVSLSDVTDTTLKQNNITKTECDTHQYYNSSFMTDKAAWEEYWVNMSQHPDLQINELLSQSHRRAATVKLKFDFPFYGHKVRNITIATGGFLYTGEYVHSWLAATQYIAPLMANFDLRLSNRSFVKYADNSTSFTVEWENVVLHDKPEDGAFTFQATLHQNGDIVFVYTAIPLVVENIKDTLHPVKVGLSDAYIMDRTVFFVRRKTIYEYHRVNFNRQDINNYTVIYLTALPTCLEMDNCNDCLTKLTDFDCKWCPELQQCSTGVSRSKQDWLLKGCDRKNIKEEASCPTRVTSYKDHVGPTGHEGHFTKDEELTANVQPSENLIPAVGPLENAHNKMNVGVSGIIGILLVISLIAGLSGWVAYAYRNPHSASGQMLIRYRPSQWSWRRGEARYTAATIHM